MSDRNSSQAGSFTDEIDDAVLQELYAWIDQIPLSRPKKNLTRDFSDGAMVAEMIHHYFPKMVEIHNYPGATGTKLKMENWHTLNRKVFKKLHFELADDVIKQVVNCKPFVIERVLLMLRTKIDTIMWEKQKESLQNDKPEADQHKQQSSFTPYSRTPENLYYGHPLGPTPRSNAKTVKNTNTNTPKAGMPTSKPPAKGAVPSQQDTPRVSSHDMVPRVNLEEKIQDCLAKDETIQILEAKVRRLEHLLHLKDIRINDLQIKVDGVRPTGVR